MIVLGVDPGSQLTGYGVVESSDAGFQLVDFGTLVLGGHEDHHLRLKQIYVQITEVIDRCLPDECAIEMPVYGKNPQSMLKLGRAQAAAILAALNRDVPVVQYTPKEVKKSVTGNGAASKQQVWYMVQSILSIDRNTGGLGHDASDALAVVLCHLHRSDAADHSRPSSGGWKAFLRDNPDRLVRG